MVTLVWGGGEGVLGEAPPPLVFNYSKEALPPPPTPPGRLCTPAGHAGGASPTQPSPPHTSIHATPERNSEVPTSSWMTKGPRHGSRGCTTKSGPFVPKGTMSGSSDTALLLSHSRHENSFTAVPAGASVVETSFKTCVRPRTRADVRQGLDRALRHPFQHKSSPPQRRPSNSSPDGGYNGQDTADSCSPTACPAVANRSYASIAFPCALPLLRAQAGPCVHECTEGRWGKIKWYGTPLHYKSPVGSSRGGLILGQTRMFTHQSGTHAKNTIFDLRWTVVGPMLRPPPHPPPPPKGPITVQDLGDLARNSSKPRL